MQTWPAAGWRKVADSKSSVLREQEKLSCSVWGGCWLRHLHCLVPWVSQLQVTLLMEVSYGSNHPIQRAFPPMPVELGSKYTVSDPSLKVVIPMTTPEMGLGSFVKAIPISFIGDLVQGRTMAVGIYIATSTLKRILKISDPLYSTAKMYTNL